MSEGPEKKGTPGSVEERVSPGPWRVNEGMLWVEAADGGLLADMGDDTGYFRYLGTSRANARLIAAAPELRDALAWALDVIKAQQKFADATGSDGYQKARALLERINHG